MYKIIANKQRLTIIVNNIINMNTADRTNIVIFCFQISAFAFSAEMAKTVNTSTFHY